MSFLGSGALPWSARTDEHLAAAYLRGDTASFEELVARYSGPVHAFILRMVGRPEEADDLTQEVFVQLLKSLPGSRADLPLRPWVYVIARNKCLDYLKRKRPLLFSSLTADQADVPPEERFVGDAPLPEDLAERADLAAILQQAIADLPPRYRTVVALRYATDLTFAEIATVLSLPENTVKTHFQRAKGILRAKLRDLV